MHGTLASDGPVYLATYTITKSTSGPTTMLVINSLVLPSVPDPFLYSKEQSSKASEWQVHGEVKLVGLGADLHQCSVG